MLPKKPYRAWTESGDMLPKKPTLHVISQGICFQRNPTMHEMRRVVCFQSNPRDWIVGSLPNAWCWPFCREFVVSSMTFPLDLSAASPYLIVYWRSVFSAWTLVGGLIIWRNVSYISFGHPLHFRLHAVSSAHQHSNLRKVMLIMKYSVSFQTVCLMSCQHLLQSETCYRNWRGFPAEDSCLWVE